jgi:hypothetical protein
MQIDFKKKRQHTSTEMFLQWYNNEGEKFLHHSVTDDETWISYINGE